MPIISVQLYTVRDFASKDVKDTLKQIKAAGYDYVELAGTYGLTGSEFRNMLDETGLKAYSAHVGLETFENNAEENVKMYKSLGCEALVVPYLGEEQLPNGNDYARTVKLMQNAVKLCADFGITFAYHNHDFEIKNLESGELILDKIVDDAPGTKLQLDLGWVLMAGQDPVSYMEKYSGRCPLVHLKDNTKVETGNEDRPVGKGLLDIPSILKKGEEIGVNCYVVELDNAVGMTSIEAIKESREYLKSLSY